MSNQSNTGTDRMDDTLIEVPRGLTNVAVAETAISQVRGLEGYYQYRGHSAIEVARTASFEQAWQLLMDGNLPDDDAGLGDQAVALQQEHRQLVTDIARRILPAQQAQSQGISFNALTGLQVGLPLIASELGLKPLYDLDPRTRRDQAVLMIALTPQLLTTLHRFARGETELVPSEQTGFVARYLHQLTGDLPAEKTVAALSTYLVAAMEHGFNASTFTARVIASTGADIAACLAGALGAFTGPLHGGAPSRALETLDEVQASGAETEQWLRDEISSGRRLMGFGHAVYRTVDPRSQMLKEVVSDLGGDRVSSALEFEEAAEKVLQELKPGRGLHANVEFYASVLLEHCGIPRQMFTPTFAVARVVGWAAHILEQAEDTKIFRPSAKFTGEQLRATPR